MKLTHLLLLILLAAIWGSSFIFMRATADIFGPVALITVRLCIAALCLIIFLFASKRRQEFQRHWRALAGVGILNSALPFSFLAYASIYLTAGTVSILNGMTPIFTAWIAHLWLKDKMTKLQFWGLLISIIGLSLLVWDKVNWNIDSWWPVLAGTFATLLYGIASNSTKKYLTNVSALTSTTGSMFFAALFMLLLLPFFLPDFTRLNSTHWLYAITLGVVCTAIAYLIFFYLIGKIGPSRSVSVTFLVPIFSFLFGYLLLDEIVTLRMWSATVIILFGMALVLRLINFDKQKLKK